MNQMSNWISRAMQIAGFSLVFLSLLGLGMQAQADAGAEAVKSVRDSTDNLVSELNANRQVYYEDAERFYEIMEGALKEVVDFERIAARVMGKHRRGASSEQQAAFIEVFKRSLFRAYGKTLVESGDFSVNVIDGEGHARDDNRATVNLQVTSSSGNVYPVVYSMYRNPQRGWLLENVIVNGVNVGLAFREKFDQEIAKARGNIDTVISGWSTTVEETEITDKS